MDDDVLKSWEVPNAFVVRGPRKAPVVVAYDDEGGVSERGMEMAECDALFPGGIAEDSFVLVHIVEGSESVLIKKLEVDSLCLNGKSVSVAELIKMNELNKIAVTVRNRYIERARKLKCAAGS